SRSTATTFAPSCANNCAPTRPIPEPAPVINAILLASFILPTCASRGSVTHHSVFRDLRGRDAGLANRTGEPDERIGRRTGRSAACDKRFKLAFAQRMQQQGLGMRGGLAPMRGERAHFILGGHRTLAVRDTDGLAHAEVAGDDPRPAHRAR